MNKGMVEDELGTLEFNYTLDLDIVERDYVNNANLEYVNELYKRIIGYRKKVIVSMLMTIVFLIPVVSGIYKICTGTRIKVPYDEKMGYYHIRIDDEIVMDKYGNSGKFVFVDGFYYYKVDNKLYNCGIFMKKTLIKLDYRYVYYYPQKGETPLDAKSNDFTLVWGIYVLICVIIGVYFMNRVKSVMKEYNLEQRAINMR